MEEKKNEMKVRFNKKLQSLSNNPNCALLTAEKYSKYVQNIKSVKSGAKKTPKDYYMLRHYDVLEVQGIEKLIFPVSVSGAVKYYITADELFTVLYDTHISLGHSGRDRMFHELNLRFKNITQKQITVFLKLCEACQQKKIGCNKSVVVKPRILNDSNSRGQINLIDLQSQPDRQFKFIFVYQDHLTKHVILRALTSKRADEVAQNLLDVFLIFGAPCVLQSDNGREFCNLVISHLKEMWPELHIVHGKSSHSQRTNQDIENMLFTWLSDNATTKWSEALRFIQFMKNRSFHPVIRRSPYEAMFGCHPKVGLQALLLLPDTILKKLHTEEDLENALTSTRTSNDIPKQDSKCTPSSSEDSQSTNSHSGSSSGSDVVSDPQSSSCILHKRGESSMSTTGG